MVKAALGVLYLLASATANGWDLLQWGLQSNTTSRTAQETEEGPGDYRWFRVGRGGRSRPAHSDPKDSQDTSYRFWKATFESVSKFWWVRIWVDLILQVAENGLHYCGTLCASIGLAAKWSYWLLTGVVIVFLLQLLVWTYTWVVHPAWVHSRALWRYCQGTGTWSDVTRLQGQRPYIPMWKGPGTSTPWTAQYVQREVRGRGLNQRPLDLLVADGVAVARLRHDTIRGRTNRHGFVCVCNEVRASSHRYFRHHLEAANCAIHLCSQDPCTAPEAAQVHIKASSVIPQDWEIDLQDLAGRGPWGRCAVLTSFCGGLWCGCCRKSLVRCAKIWCWCISCRRRPRRVSRPGGGPEHGQSDRHDDSETESEAEVGPADQPCQADQIAVDSNGKVTSLAMEPCRDIARGQPVCLLSADKASSCLDGLPTFADGTTGFHACEYHRSLYQGSLHGGQGMRGAGLP